MAHDPYATVGYVSSQKKMLPSGLDGQRFPHLKLLPAAGLLSRRPFSLLQLFS
jgi:hypothetical protein